MKRTSANLHEWIEPKIREFAKDTLQKTSYFSHKNDEMTNKKENKKVTIKIKLKPKDKN